MYPQSVYWGNNKKNRYMPMHLSFPLYKYSVSGGGGVYTSDSCVIHFDKLTDIVVFHSFQED